MAPQRPLPSRSTPAPTLRLPTSKILPAPVARATPASRPAPSSAAHPHPPPPSRLDRAPATSPCRPEPSPPLAPITHHTCARNASLVLFDQSGLADECNSLLHRSGRES